CCGDAIALYAEPCSVPLCPLLHAREETFIQKLRLRLAPIVTDIFSLRPNVNDERGEIRLQIVTAPPLELFQKIAGPVLVIDLQTVTEDCVRFIARTESLHQPVAYCFQVVLCGGTIHVVENKALTADSGPLDLHASAARNEEHHLVRPFEVGRQPNCAVFNLRQLADAFGDDFVTLRAHQKSANEFLARRHFRQGYAPSVTSDLHAFGAELACRLVNAHRGSTKWPATAECQIHSQT